MGINVEKRELIYEFVHIRFLYFIKGKFENYVLNKKLKQYLDILYISPPIELKKEITKLPTVKEELLFFYKRMGNVFPQQNLVLFYNNVNNLKIVFKKYAQADLVAFYNVYKNKIVIIQNDKLTLTHELFHMASTYVKNKTVFSGLSYKKAGGIIIGIGLNEGYTELLTQRYFGVDNNVSYTYLYLVKITSILERLIGKEKMEFFYLNAYLHGLILELKNYKRDGEIINFIAFLDDLELNLVDCIKKNNEKLKYINDFLISCHFMKNKRLFEEGKLTLEQVFNECSLLLTSFTDVFLGKDKIEQMIEYNNRLNAFIQNLKFKETIESGVKEK